MANIQVTGVLTTPMNNAIEATIRVTALENEGDATTGTLIGLTDSVVTGEDGSYDFGLVYGKHEIEVYFSDEYIVSGEVVIDVTVPNPITLPELLDI